MTSAESGNQLRAAKENGPREWPQEVEMDAVFRGWDLTMRRGVAAFLGLVAIALIAGGAGGYLMRGATTLVVTHTITSPAANPAQQPDSGVRTTGGYISGL
jgi:hypothetical protein